MKFFLPFFFLISCSQKQKNQVSLNSTDEINDTLYKYSASKVEETVIRSLIIDSSFYTLKDIKILISDTSILNEYNLNDQTLVEIVHRNNLGSTVQKRVERSFSDIYLFDSCSKIILTSLRLTGSRYHNYELSINDWNKDGSDEIIVTLISPTSSVPVIDNFLQVIALDPTDQKLKNIFQLNVDSRDCGLGVESGLQVIANFNFIDTNILRVTRSYYSFNCDHFNFKFPIVGSKLDSTKSILMTWNKEKFTFE